VLARPSTSPPMRSRSCVPASKQCRPASASALAFASCLARLALIVLPQRRQCLSGAGQPDRHHHARIRGWCRRCRGRSDACRRFIQSRNFRAFETYGDHRRLSRAAMRCAVLARCGRRLFAGRRRDRVHPLDLATQTCCWRADAAASPSPRRAASAAGPPGVRVSRSTAARKRSSLYRTLPGTPLLIAFPRLLRPAAARLEVSPWLAATVSLALLRQRYLVEIWRGSVEAVPHGQWTPAPASACLLRQSAWSPAQALRLAVPPTVGFLGSW